MWADLHPPSHLWDHLQDALNSTASLETPTHLRQDCTGGAMMSSSLEKKTPSYFHSTHGLYHSYPKTVFTVCSLLDTQVDMSELFMSFDWAVSASASQTTKCALFSRTASC